MLTESKFLELYNRQQESGLNVKEFCANEKIKESTFYYWRKKLTEQGRIKNFIPLVVKPTAPTKQEYSKDTFSKTTDTENDFLLELVYSNGTKLRIKNDLDLNHLRTLISLYD